MNYVKELEITDIIKIALKEDIGVNDITTNTFIGPKKIAEGIFMAKEDLIVCGLGVVSQVFKAQDKTIGFSPVAKDGDCVKKGNTIAKVKGNARNILTAERVALNFLSLLSGISTKTRKYVDACRPYKTKIIDTRKTIPGLRLLQKYAVRIGGGYNHRLTLDEMILIKDNHLQVIGGINKLLKLTNKYKIEIEVKNLKEFRHALTLKPDIIMLDNMPVKEMKKAVEMNKSVINPVMLEASGGITLNNVKSIASCGIDMISIGGLTHSIDAVDISLEIG